MPAGGAAHARPDLAVRAVSDPPAAAQPGASFSVVQTVVNKGRGKAGRTRTAYYLSADGKVGSGDTLLGERSQGKLRPRKRSRGTKMVEVPATAIGAFHVIACADAGGALRERNERNNCRASAGTVTVTQPLPPNAAPTLSTTQVALGYTEQTGERRVDAGLAVDDVDSATLAGATVQISGNHAAAEDNLAFAGQNGISGTYEDAGGTLTLSGVATVAQYQTALRSVTYSNSASAPSLADRTVTFTVSDGRSQSAPASRTIMVNVPVITASGFSPTTIKNDATFWLVDPAITVEDGDDANLEGATIRVVNCQWDVSGGDALTVTGAVGITVSTDFPTCTVTLSGTASYFTYQSMFRDVRYGTNTDNPVTPKVVEFTATDGDRYGPPATVTFNVGDTSP